MSNINNIHKDCSIVTNTLNKQYVSEASASFLRWNHLILRSNWLKYNKLCNTPKNTVEPRLSELRLTETRVNRNACQALRSPELPAARHIWASPRQFVVKSWLCGRVSNWRVCCLQCSCNICVTVIANMSVGRNMLWWQLNRNWRLWDKLKVARCCETSQRI
jgi:hypothetical protein